MPSLGPAQEAREAPGVTATVILLDPIERPRAAPWISLEDARSVRPRHQGYVGLVEALRGTGWAS